MGMEYTYAGSASYSRFNEELSAVAEIFNGVQIGTREFNFPKETDETLVKWFNNIYYHRFSPEETKMIWKLIKEHPEIEELSNQIWYELESCISCGDSWYIFM